MNDDEDLDFPISRAFFHERLWHRTKPRRLSKHDRTAEDVAELRRQRDEWCGEAVLLRRKVAELEKRLAALSHPTQPAGGTPAGKFSGIRRLTAT